MAFEFFKQLLRKEAKPQKVDINAMCFNIASEIYIRELAFNLVKNKITNAVTKCNIDVFKNNKRVKDDEWYRWNIQPNKNQNANQFWSKMIDKLYDTNEALIIVQNNELFVADSYSKKTDTVLFEHSFHQVTVNGLTFNKTYYMSDVFYFELNSKNLKSFLDGTLSLYSGLINAAYSNYINNTGNKGFVKVDQFVENKDDFEETFKEIINQDFKTFFENANAIMPLYDGYAYEEYKNNGLKVSSKDIKEMFDSVITLSANAVGMPVSIAIGNVQDTSKSIDEFLTFCIDPLVEMIALELNRKLFTKYQILDGIYVKFDTKAIKHIDLLDVHTAIDKLISSGFACINDLREVCGFTIIDEDWANQFFMTKNYSTIEELIRSLKGGGEDEKE